MNIGYHAPPPHSRSGVAEYAETLRVALSKLDISTSGSDPAVHLYHIGNNSLHRDIYAEALRRPGVAVLHDAVLHHFMLGHLSRDEYISEFVYNYGEWRRHLGEELWEKRGGSGVDARYFEFPMLRRIVEASRAIVVHNPAAAKMAEEHGARNVQVVPHFVTPRPPIDHARSLQFRERHGISVSATLFGIFGYLRETKRVLPCIAAFTRLHALRPDTALLIAGEAVSPDLSRLLANQMAHPAIRRAGFLSEDEFDEAVSAINCCLNLRYPGAGETSGVTIRMAAGGTPLIVTQSQEYAAFPEASCLRVRPGVAEAGELFDHMNLVTEFPHLARAIGSEARRHMADGHSLETVARQYRDLLCNLAG